MIHDETAAQNSGGAPGFARLARVAHPPLRVTYLASYEVNIYLWSRLTVSLFGQFVWLSKQFSCLCRLSFSMQLSTNMNSRECRCVNNEDCFSWCKEQYLVISVGQALNYKAPGVGFSSGNTDPRYPFMFNGSHDDWISTAPRPGWILNIFMNFLLIFVKFSRI